MSSLLPMTFISAIPLSHQTHRPYIQRHRPTPRLPHRRTHLHPYATATNSKVEIIEPSSTDSLISTLEPYLPTPQTLPPNLLPEIVRHLGDPRGMARLALVEALGDIGEPAIPYLLTSLSSHPNPVVRRSSGKALAKIPHPSALKALIHALVHDPDTVTRSSAAGALARMGSDAIPELFELISNPNVSTTAKGHATWAIAFMKDSSEALMEGLRNPNVDVRTAVVSALGALAIGDALPAMGGGSEDDWGDTDDDVRARAEDALKEALDDEEPAVKAEAATALANAGCAQEAERIAMLLNDDDAELRRCAALALMKLGDTSFVPVLRQRHTDEKEVDGVRSVCKLAADSLERLVLDDDDWV